ncbi:MAG: hypothetical protein M1839_004102 [Geoglossum umbratile]|nr:MAG: hypothetical protein M1839_004102 [Geoglossum umbratile]
MATLESITTSRTKVESDLHTYFSSGVKNLQDMEYLSSDCSCEELVGCLLSGADGMFLWAHLIMSYLSISLHNKTTRLKCIKTINSPEGMDKMYIRILDLITTKTKVEQQFARKIFLWLIYQQRHLSTEELYDAMRPLEEGANGADGLVNFESTMVVISPSSYPKSLRVLRGLSQTMSKFLSNKLALMAWIERCNNGRNGHRIWKKELCKKALRIFRLCCLPSPMILLEDASVNIHTKTREEKINMILNKAARPWYNLSDPADVHLPAIQKDVRALGPLRKRNVRGNLVSCDRENERIEWLEH